MQNAEFEVEANAAMAFSVGPQPDRSRDLDRLIEMALGS